MAKEKESKLVTQFSDLCNKVTVNAAQPTADRTWGFSASIILHSKSPHAFLLGSVSLENPNTDVGTESGSKGTEC